MTGRLGLGRVRAAGLVGRGVIRPVEDEDGEVVGFDPASVIAEQRRRDDRGLGRTLWDGVKAVLRWLP